MKLYFAAGSCSLSPHIVLQELALAYDLVRVDNRTKRTSEGGDFRLVTPKGYVAALMLDDGTVLTEGAVIVQYLADLKPEAGLAAAPGTLARLRLQEWLNFISSEIHAGSAPLFDPLVSGAVRQAIADRLGRRLDLVAAQLDRQEYLAGDRFSVADAYLFAVMGWMPGLGVAPDRWPALAGYLARIGGRPSVAAALAREASVAAAR